MFLLDLASTSGGRSTGDEQSSTSGPWAVGEFKCLDKLEAPVACKQLLQSETCNDALLQHLHNCDSAGVRIYSSRPPVNSVVFFSNLYFIHFSTLPGLVSGQRYGRRNRDAEFSPIRINGHREVTAETTRHDQPSQTDQ